MILSTRPIVKNRSCVPHILTSGREEGVLDDYTECQGVAQTTLWLNFSQIEAFEFGESILKKQLFFPDWSIAMFADDDIGDAFAL